MQIILTEQECQIIHQALEHFEFKCLDDMYQSARKNNKEHNIAAKEKRTRTANIMKRFEPYLKEVK